MTFGGRLFRASPVLVTALIFVPVVAGLLGTLGPALSWGADGGPNLSAFAALWAWPGFGRAAFLSVFTGLSSALLACTLALLITATTFERPGFARFRSFLAPLLAMPHAAAALGLAFLLAPSGLIARALSPWATGWVQPPDLLILNDPWGLSLMLGLTVKELPFLMLMIFAALPQCDATRRMQVARSMGYGDVMGFVLTVLPDLYRQMRLPCLAVLAYAMTSADMGQVLGPTRPPTLTVQITHWMMDPSLRQVPVAAAGSVVQLGLTLTAMALWLLAEGLLRHLRNATAFAGRRAQWLDCIRPLVAGLAAGEVVVLALAFATTLLWSVSGLWPFPTLWPESLNLTAWGRAAPDLAITSATTLTLALISACLALGLTLAFLQAEYLHGLAARTPWLLYLPLLIPQICFLPGQALLVLRLESGTGLASVMAAHLVFVLPYVFLSLSQPFRAWDTRVATVAATLGASPARIFWRLRLPMLLAPVLAALTIGMAVSIGQYLPTLLIGGGRVSTLTTEAVALSSGGNRRLTSAYALLQTIFPLMGFAIALWVPRLILSRQRTKAARGT